MKLLSVKDIPDGYEYYRSHSRAYISYITTLVWPGSIHIASDDAHIYAVPYFFWLFHVVHAEKTDVHITRELLRQHGVRQWVILQSTWRESRPEGAWWHHLGYLISHWYHHSTRSAFSVLDTSEHTEKWSSSARWHIRKIRKELDAGIIKIDTKTSLEDFISAYRKTPVHHKWKRYNIYRQKYLSTHFPENIRIYTASIDGEIFAGAIFLDDMPTSTYLIAFQHDRAKSHHLGLALIDRWFHESVSLGYRYLDFDHMQDSLDPSSYSGYTRFKSELADYELRFPTLWMRLFF